MKNCELCNILNNNNTKEYGRYLDIDDPFIILECQENNIPMVIFINHSEPKPKGFLNTISIVKKLFPDKKIDLKRETNKQHPHFYIKDI